MTDRHELAFVAEFRLRRGELAYRQALQGLPPVAQRIVFMYEQGMPPDDIIHNLAWKYHTGRGYRLTPEELRPAEVEFIELVRDIRKVMDSKLDPKTTD